MSNEVIVIRQLPEIEEHLHKIKEDVTERVNQAMSLVCTEDTRQAIKKIRAELNKEFQGWEAKRKEVKTALMTPYEKFEVVYKDCIADVYKKGDADLKSKIESVEDALKEETREEVCRYFAEYMESKNKGLHEFISFQRANINVTLSASKKSLKEQAKAFIDRICDDLDLIDTQEHKDEILYEYKQTLNASAAIMTVANRYKAIEEAKKREEERKAREEADRAAAEKVEAVVETLTPPTVVETLTPPTAVEPFAPVSVRKFSFEVTASDAKIKKLIEFLESENYYYECI